MKTKHLVIVIVALLLNSKFLLGCIYEMFCKMSIISFFKD